MFCIQCGTKLIAGAVFCNNCGKRQSDDDTQQQALVQETATQTAYIPPTQDTATQTAHMPPTQETVTQTAYMPPAQETAMQTAYMPPAQQATTQTAYMPPAQQAATQTEYMPPAYNTAQQNAYIPAPVPKTAKPSKGFSYVILGVSLALIAVSVVFILRETTFTAPNSGSRQSDTQASRDDSRGNQNEQSSGQTSTPSDSSTQSIQALDYEDEDNFSLLASAGGGAYLGGYKGDSTVVVIPPTVRTVFANDTPVTQLRQGIFKDNHTITSVVIPNTVNNIYEDAFRNCINLVSLYFEGNAPTFGNNVFLETPVENLTIYYKQGSSGWSNPFTIGDVSISTQTY